MILKSKHIDKSLDVIDKLVIDKDKKQEIASNIVDKELNSGSWFVRSARPMIIYTGLLLVMFEFFGLRLLALQSMSATAIMVESSTQIFQFYLISWSSVISLYTGARTFEKYKARRLFKGK